RTPGYPAFVAAVYAVFGIGNDLAVTFVQAFVFAALCLLVYGIGRRVAGHRAGLAAAGATALFSPIPHFVALVLTEFWTTFVLTAAMWFVVRAVRERRLLDFAIGGVLLSATTLVRPAFVLLPFFLAIGMPLLVRRERQPRALAAWA